MLWRRYRAAVQATVVASAAPYGYTLTIWTSGAVLSHARGIPNSGETLFFLLGAVAAYALVGALAFVGVEDVFAPDSGHAVVWGGLHIFSVGFAIGAASLVANTIRSPFAWPLGSFLVTAVYLIGSALQLATAHATRRR